MNIKLKVLISSLLLSCSVLIVNADTPTSTEITLPANMSCFPDIQAQLDILQNKYGERILFVSDIDEDNTQTAILYNKNSRSYSIVQLMVLVNNKGETKPVICSIDSGRAELKLSAFAEFFN